MLDDTDEYNALPADEDDDKVLFYDNYTERLKWKGRGRKRGINIHTNELSTPVILFHISVTVISVILIYRNKSY